MSDASDDSTLQASSHPTRSQVEQRQNVPTTPHPNHKSVSKINIVIVLSYCLRVVCSIAIYRVSYFLSTVKSLFPRKTI